jgi:hypothetical protein
MSFDVGTRDLLLKMVQTGGIQGSIRYSIPEIKRELRIWLQLSNEALGRHQTSVRLRPDGTFLVRGLDAGFYTLNVSISGHRDTVIPGIEVRGGEVAEPSSLRDLLVGQSMNLALVHVTNPIGQPMKGVRVSFARESVGQSGTGRSRQNSSERTDAQGYASIMLAQGASVNVTVRDAIHLPVDISDALFPLEIRLVEAPLLTLSFPPLPELEGVRRYIVALAEPEPSKESAPAEATRRNGPRRGNYREVSLKPGITEATFRNVSPGTYIVRVYVEANNSKRIRELTTAIKANGEIFFMGGRLGPFPIGEITWANTSDRTITLNPDFLSAVQALLDEVR